MLELKAQFKTAAGIDWKPGVAVPQAVTEKSSGNSEAAILSQIAEQGEKVRKIKADKAPKDQVDSAVKILLELKAEYKKVTGKDWKPGAQPSSPPVAAAAAPAIVSAAAGGSDGLSAEITAQGDLVRKLKAAKASKKDIDGAVKVLLDLKAKFKAASGQDWKPGETPAAAIVTSPSSPAPASPAPESSPQSGTDQRNSLLQKIAQQGDKVRITKAAKADKSTIDAEVKILLALKAEFKSATGEDWKPDSKPTGVPATLAATPAASATLPNSDLNTRITEQGDKVRKLKGEKATKGVIDVEVKALLALKAEYKNLTGSDWKPGVSPVPTSTPAPAASTTPATMSDNKVESLVSSVNAQGEKVRQLKASGAGKVSFLVNPITFHLKA